MSERDISQSLIDQVQQLAASKTKVNILAGQSKSFYGNAVEAQDLSVSEHCGVIHYEPTELVITARCGTPLKDIELLLSENNQILGFEPPHFADTATLGGSIACGLSGPARPYRGAARDFVLGTRIINGKGEQLRFGGEVMKNVAGYDVSRLMTGAMGTLGVLLDISLKVLPKPETECSLLFELEATEAIARMNTLSAQSLPLSAACHDGEHLYLRLSGNDAAVESAHKHIGGERIRHGEQFWSQLKELRQPFFQTKQPLWRLSLAAASPPLGLSGKQFIDWAGAQRWLVSEEDPDIIRERVAALGGHATLFRQTDEVPSFQPLTGKLRELHINLKLAFDPHCLFNPGRLYPDL